MKFIFGMIIFVAIVHICTTHRQEKDRIRHLKKILQSVREKPLANLGRTLHRHHRAIVEGSIHLQNSQLEIEYRRGLRKEADTIVVDYLESVTLIIRGVHGYGTMVAKLQDEIFAEVRKAAATD